MCVIIIMYICILGKSVLKEDRIVRNRHVACVILGDGFSSRILCLALRVCRGVSCIICDTKRSLSGCIFPTAKFFALCHTKEDRLWVSQLEDIADSDNDGLYFLIALKDKYRAPVKVYADVLECRYIFTDKHRVFSDITPCDI